MAKVREMQRPLTLVAVALAIIAAAATAVLLSPMADASKRAAQQKQVHSELQKVMHEAIPLQNVDEKIRSAQQQVSAFYKNRLPQRDSDIASELGSLAGDAGVRLGNVRYNQPTETDLPNLQKLEMDISLAGEYQRVVKFINALERDRIFFIVDRVNLAEQQGGNVRLELHLETYLKQGQASAPRT
ncbi:MAG TPA: type 4a pilus biogenesis protein PilO [Terriglobales bacterium]|nr:type 4a pilus biogenesis protein PilO [Terriglobales bacterium]